MKELYKFKIEIGDPSGDGHSKCEILKVKCNISVNELRKAYIKSCKLTGLQFHGMYNDADYTGLNLKWDHPEYDNRQIAVEYQKSTISKLAEEILKEHGIDVWEGYDSNVYNFEKDEAFIDGSEHFFELMMKFINLSTDKEIEYEIYGDDLETFNVGELNHQFGYGLFN